MTFSLFNRVRETTITTGTGAVALLGAISGYRAFNNVLVNGDTTWYAIVLPGSSWEVGTGTWVTGNTLQRTSVLESSNANALVNFGAGTKDVFIALPASAGNIKNNTFPSGTLMLFQQTSAPIYWTKQVTHNNKALRVVSGAAGSGGTTPFSSMLNNTLIVSNTTITITTMPSHSHLFTSYSQIRNDGVSVADAMCVPITNNSTTASTGLDGAHNHTLGLDIQYVDLIIASKD